MKDKAATPEVHCKHSGMQNIEDLKPHPRNPNTHGDKQIALLAKNIRHLGWRHPILVSELTGYIVAGHARLEAAKVLQLAEVPVDVQSFDSETEEQAYLVADNRIAELAETQQEAIAGLLAELESAGLDTDLTGYTEDVIDGMQQEDADAEDMNETIFEQSIQLEPAQEFLLVKMTAEDYEDAKIALALDQVRRGGYKSGSAFDSVGWERCITWGRIKDAICNSK